MGGGLAFDSGPLRVRWEAERVWPGEKSAEQTECTGMSQSTPDLCSSPLSFVTALLLPLLLVSFPFLFWLHCEACGVLVPRQGIESWAHSSESAES